jgi:4-amino-4-deoxy-L-arabinose transferase-like glycosyltransferase
MSLRKFIVRWWADLVFPLLFICTGWCLLPYPGLHNDELLFASAQFHLPAAALFEVTILQHTIPLMFLTYLGALKAWLYAPVLALFEPSYVSVRLPVLLLGGLTVWLVMRLLESMHGRRAAWIGGLLLATDTMYILTTCFDWGPVALQHFLLVAGLLLVLKFAVSANPLALFCGFGCFGLGMWDKALFIWMLVGIMVAAVVVFHREVWALMTWRNAGLAAAGFCVGALPLLAYNISSGFGTLRTNSSFVFTDFSTKAWALRSTWNGSSLVGFFVNPTQADHPREAQGPAEQFCFKVNSLFGEHRRNRMEGAFLVALLLTPVLLFTRARRPVSFCLITLAVAWFQMAIAKNAGSAAHHIVLLWPIPHLFLAVTFAEASLRLRKIGGWVLVVAMLYLAAENLFVTNQYFYQLARYGPSSHWTDAIYDLSRSVGELKPSKLVIDDWGLINQLVLLHRGQLHLEFADERFLSASLSAEERNLDRERLEHGLWLGHTTPYEEFHGTNDRILKAAASAGFHKELIKVIADRNGRPVFEIFRFK